MLLTHTKNVDLNLLVALWHLLESRSVTAAANALGLSQPAMSRTLGRLRKTFGDPLLVRSGAGLTPTPRALALRPQLEEVLRGAELLVAGPEVFSPEVAERTFTVATSDYGEAVLLPALLRQLGTDAPGVRVRVVQQMPDWEAQLEHGGIDLLWAPKTPAGRQVVWTRLFDETFQFVLRRGHPALRGAWTMARYLSLRHVALAPQGRDDRNPMDAALQRQGLRRQVVLTVPSFLVVPSLVEQSDAGATLPRRIVAALSGRHHLVSRELPFPTAGFALFQAWHERMRRDPGHVWLRQLVAALGRAS